MKIGIVYGSTTGNTEEAAVDIQNELNGRVDDIHEVIGLDLSVLTEFDVLLVGVPTWDIGQLEENWERAVGDLQAHDFTGIQVAFFGEGDQFGYPDNFQDALGILRDRFVALGAEANIGHWPIDGYEFDQSKGVIADQFVGLALDSFQQPELHDERIQRWVEQVLTELGLA
ncbi:MAG: flavodoxin [Pseudomonadota bacterium]